MTDDEHWLRRAMELAQQGMEAGDGGPFGCVIVRKGTLIAEGWNRVLSTPDPTAHAEVEAIRAAARALESFDLGGCTLYASCEPCPMCLAASLWARVERVVYAASQQEAAAIGFDDVNFYAELAKKPSQRRLPLEQQLGEEGAKTLRKWCHFAGRQGY